MNLKTSRRLRRPPAAPKHAVNFSLERRKNTEQNVVAGGRVPGARRAWTSRRSPLWGSAEGSNTVVIEPAAGTAGRPAGWTVASFCLENEIQRLP